MIEGGLPAGVYTVFVLCFFVLFFYRPSRRRGKSLPTGFATTYRGAYASEHATETMRKAAYLTPCEIPGEIAPKKKKEIRKVLLFFLVLFLIFIFIPAVVTDRFAPVMRQEDGLLGGLWRSLVSLVQSHITTSPTFRQRRSRCPPPLKIYGEKESPCVARTRIGNKNTSRGERAPLDGDIKGGRIFFFW